MIAQIQIWTIPSRINATILRIMPQIKCGVIWIYLYSPFNASFKNEYMFLIFYTTLLWVPRRTRELGTLEQVLYSQGTQCYSFQLEQSAYWPGILTWNIDLEYWTGIFTWNIDLEYWPGNLTWNINLEYWPGILTWKLDLEY